MPHCCNEGPCKELAGKWAPNNASNCASEQPHLPLKRVLDEVQLPVLLTVHRLRLDVPRASQQHYLFEGK